jgi:hypothetical protein
MGLLDVHILPGRKRLDGVFGIARVVRRNKLDIDLGIRDGLVGIGCLAAGLEMLEQ